jgi:hypothetical protein
MTYGCGKSDSAILAGKPTNKAEQSAAEADAAFYSAKNDAAAKAMGVKPCAFPIAPAKAASANASRRSVGAMGKNGGPDARGASAWSSGDTVSIAAATKASTE